MFLAMAIPLLRARNPFAIAYEAILNEFVSSPVVGQRAIEDMLPSAIKKHTEEHNALVLGSDPRFEFFLTFQAPYHNSPPGICPGSAEVMVSKQLGKDPLGGL